MHVVMAVEAMRRNAEDPLELINLRGYNETECRSQSGMINHLRESIAFKIATDPFLMLSQRRGTAGRREWSREIQMQTAVNSASSRQVRPSL